MRTQKAKIACTWKKTSCRGREPKSTLFDAASFLSWVRHHSTNLLYLSVTIFLRNAKDDDIMAWFFFFLKKKPTKTGVSALLFQHDSNVVENTINGFSLWGLYPIYAMQLISCQCLSI
jgi:hypothetical protein